MEFVENYMTSRKPGSDSKYKTNKSRWTDPEADLFGNEALLQAGILQLEAQKKLDLEIEAAKLALLSANVESGLVTPTITEDGNEEFVVKDGEYTGPEITYDEWGQPSHIKEGDSWISNPAFGIDPNAKTPTPTSTSTQTLEDFAAFEKRFEGLAGLDELKAAIEAGTYTGMALEDITPAFFNDMVGDASGILPGGWSPEAGFYSSGSGDYAETYLTEPSFNEQTLHNGLKAFHEITTATGETRWIRNPGYVAKGDTGTTGIGGKDSIEKTNLLTDAERNAQLAAAGVESATAILQRLAGAFGLPTTVVAKLKQFMVDGLSEEAIALEIRQTDEYKTRFPGMGLRRDNGFGAITEAEYMANEDEYAMLLRTHGLPERFYDDRMDFAELIAADVSPNEFGERVTLAELATKGADPNTKAELKRLFDVDETDLVAYYLDPEGATNLIEERRAFEAAGLSATAARVIGTTTGFDRETATALQREGIQRREIQQTLTPQAGLTNQALGEQDEISASDLAQSQFGLDPTAANKVRRRREERAAGFSGQSGMLVTGTGATGMGTST